ncbi:MAG: hypothetical protein HF976_10955 [ANME-2 cluster archaeon]|nr:hypothetical protein [ANME-2 cluster archaeon]
MRNVWRACRWGRLVVAVPVPGVSVFEERARVGYEIAISSVDEEQVET